MAQNQRSNINKLKKIKSICTSFNTGLEHRPFNNKLDQARTASVLTDILTILWTEELKEVAPSSPKEYWKDDPPTLDPDAQKELNLKALKKIRTLKKIRNRD